MKKLLLSLLIVSLVQDNFAMQSGGAADNTAGENSSSIYLQYCLIFYLCRGDGLMESVVIIHLNVYRPLNFKPNQY